MPTADATSTLSDYAYLLSRHPIDLWTAEQLIRDPDLSWSELFARSDEPRAVVSSWLLRTKNRSAQNTRLRIRIERDAFARMTPYWQRLGFPFQRLGPDAGDGDRQLLRSSRRSGRPDGDHRQ